LKPQVGITIDASSTNPSEGLEALRIAAGLSEWEAVEVWVYLTDPEVLKAITGSLNAAGEGAGIDWLKAALANGVVFYSKRSVSLNVDELQVQVEECPEGQLQRLKFESKTVIEL
jgi:hypothetical protein